MSKIFFIDDEPALCELFEDLLQDNDHHLYTFTKPEQAISRAYEIDPDFIFADYRMIPINGLQLIREIGNGRKCYLITGELDLQIDEPLVIEVISKPFRFQKILRIIDQDAQPTS